MPQIGSLQKKFLKLPQEILQQKSLQVKKLP
ncbi:hypothetical protein CCACVL1_04414 [Corchorus capsularis]|uniref:Uncharacterized protein n=1 Tax=Corchorus capsularis TaxID=210143 RepID=A0A1R3JSX5_COCAP|nr:hypothetical protein CCACVL1_04414 [Corchorus capsularis]